MITSKLKRQVSSVSVLTTIQVKRSGLNSLQGQGYIFFATDRPWWPINLLSNGYRWLFPRG